MHHTVHTLRNHLSKEEAMRRLGQEPFNRRVFSFYRYVILDNPEALRNELYAEWMELGVLGRIYVANEGINAQMSVPEPNLENFQKLLYARPMFADVPFKFGVEQHNDAFWKLTIKVRRQIVADGLAPEDYDVTNVGTHLTAKEWNELSGQSKTVIVDMRNNYESAIGHFEKALCPPSYTFREELPFVKEALKGQEQKDILLYCTGGIRCEKASAYLKHHGFKRVYQLHGGIIDYARQIERDGLASQFKGKNFVFDHRFGERITDDVLGQCYQCDVICDLYTNCLNEQCNMLFLQCGACDQRYAGCCGTECQSIIALPEQERVKLRKEKRVSNNTATFRKRIAITHT
ncbi:MAG: rhodanese-related sulfurtransferase [Minisyncoccota bacterium]